MQRSSSRYSLRVSRVDEVVWKPGIHSKEPSLYLELTVGNAVRKTRIVKKNLAPVWDEDIALPSVVSETSTITVRLLHDSLFKDTLIGRADVVTSSLLRMSRAGEATISLRLSAQTQTAVLHIRLTAVDTNTAVKIDVGNAVKDVTVVANTEPAKLVSLVGDANDLYQPHADVYGHIGDMVQKLDAIKAVIDDVAKIHPYLNAAWQVTTALYRVISNQVKTDQDVALLAAKLSVSLDFALDVQGLQHKLNSIQSTLAKLFNQITECCLFIREYTGKGFAGRMIRVGNKEKVAAFLQALDEITKAIDQGVVLNTGIVTTRMASQIHTLYLKSQLDPDDTDLYGRRACLEGTRVSTLEEITSWLLNDSSQRILWLYGAAGSGKSTISRSVQDYICALSRLGAYLCFERGKSTPNGVVRTLAYQLACYDSNIADSITASVGSSDIKSSPLQTQYEILLEKPLSSVVDSVVGPVVIILDAMDECGTSRTRKDLLKVFGEFTKLPSHFRFFVTSRPELDLHKTFTSSPWSSTVHAVELDCNSAETRSNVLTFLKHEIHDVAEPYEDSELLPQWEANIEKLADASSGLFISASTAVKMIEVSDDPFGTLEELVSGKIRLDELDQLYSAVLKNSGIQWDKEASKTRFQDIVSFLLLRKAPLYDTTVDGILGLSLQHSARFILEKLQPLITYERGKPLTFRHITIADYFVDSSKMGKPWSVDVDPRRYALTSRCFSTMESSLRFNICGLQSSFLPNDAIKEFDQKCNTAIPPPLEYACLCWAQHLCDCDATTHPQLQDDLSAFLYQRLLFWAEVLSALKKFKAADKILCDAGRWLDPTTAPDLIKFLKDARMLLNRFSEPISESIPHIYVSMLLLMKDESLAAAHYYQHISNPGIQIIKEGRPRPSHHLKTLEADGIGFINAVVFNPVEHTQVISGSEDGRIRVWDVESGELSYAPAVKHDGAVLAVALSHDAAWVVSGSRDCTVRAWHMEDDASSVIGTHESPVMAVAASRNSDLIVSGSEAGTVKVWSLAANVVESPNYPVYALAVLSIAFRPSSYPDSVNHVVSSSLDGSLCMWNVDTGEVRNLPLSNSESWIQSLVFTVDGMRLICGSDSGNISIRDVEAGTILHELSGHSECVHSLTVSPCNGYIASASSDQTVRIWNIEKCSSYEPFVEDGDMYCVTWSTDNHHIVSGSSLGKILVYDASVLNGQLLLDTPGLDTQAAADSPMSYAIISEDNSWIASAGTEGLVDIWRQGPSYRWEVSRVCKGHRETIWSMSISPDQKRLLTGSADTTARIWNLDEDAGEPVIFHVDCGVRGVAFSPLEHSSWIATAGLDGYIRIWNTEDGQVLYSLREVAVHATCVAFLPDGKRIASGQYDGVVRVWDIEGDRVIHALGVSDQEQDFSGRTDAVLTVKISSNGKLAAGFRNNGTFKIWDVESGDLLLGPVRGHEGNLFSLAFSPMADRITSASWDADGLIKVWDVITGRCLSIVRRGHTTRVKSLTISSDGTWLISTSHDATVRIWETAKFLDYAPALRQDGWLVGENNAMLLWIPPDIRPSLLWESAQVDVFGIGFSTRIQLTGFRENEWSQWFQQ